MLKLKIFNIRTCFNIGLNPIALFTSVANNIYVGLFCFFLFLGGDVGTLRCVHLYSFCFKPRLQAQK